MLRFRGLDTPHPRPTSWTQCTYTHPIRTHLPQPSEPVDSTNWLNIAHDMYTSVTKVTGNFGPPEGWHGLVPHNGTLSFDFVSSQVGGGKVGGRVRQWPFWVDTR